MFNCFIVEDTNWVSFMCIYYKLGRVKKVLLKLHDLKPKNENMGKSIRKT